jgi:hypothetical protein
MRGCATTLALLLLTIAWLLAPIAPARACGFGEAPAACGDSLENEAKYMLNRVVTAINADKTRALQAFTRGEDGFRSIDTYVFCVGPDGIMTAHPSALLQGQNVKDLHDPNGVYFIATMMKTAKAGEVAHIRYSFPRPGGNVATPKTTYYTRAGDQVCGVGVYDGDESAATSPATSPQLRLAQLRQRLGAEVPANLRDDWNGFLQALDEQTTMQQNTILKTRDQLRSIEEMLSPEPQK